MTTRLGPEAPLFKTSKYASLVSRIFPVRGSGPSQDVLSIVLPLVRAEHRHGGISMLTPEQVHFGNADQVHCRQEIRAPRSMEAAHPERFVRGVPNSQTAPGGRLHQSSHPFPHHTGHCSLINPVECLTGVDRFMGVTHSLLNDRSTVRMIECTHAATALRLGGLRCYRASPRAQSEIPDRGPDPAGKMEIPALMRGLCRYRG